MSWREELGSFSRCGSSRPGPWDRLLVASGAAALRCGNLHNKNEFGESHRVQESAVVAYQEADSRLLARSEAKIRTTSTHKWRTHTPVVDQFIRASVDCLFHFLPDLPHCSVQRTRSLTKVCARAVAR